MSSNSFILIDFIVVEILFTFIQAFLVSLTSGLNSLQCFVNICFCYCCNSFTIKIVTVVCSLFAIDDDRRSIVVIAVGLYRVGLVLMRGRSGLVERSKKSAMLEWMTS